MKPIILALLLAALPAIASAQQPDPKLAADIDAIPAIDNHAHVAAPTLSDDRGFDALPCDLLSQAPAELNVNMRFTSDASAAWKALWGVVATDTTPEAIREWQARKQAAHQKLGADYANWVLQKANVETVLANRVSMAPGLERPHFAWVPYDDALLFPLDNSAAKSASPDRRVFFGQEEEILKSYLTTAGLSSPPATLEEYVQRVVTPTLQRDKNEGAVAIKFEVAYLRSLDFAPAQEDAAASVYAGYIKGGVPSAVAYRTLQDFLFRYIAAEAGRLGLAVHIHTGIGCGDYFQIAGSNPLLLESVFSDPALRHTNFVILHGGTPFSANVTALLMKPNVYADTSLMEWFFSPQDVANFIRPWLEMAPGKVLLGTDAGPTAPGIDWEEATWLGVRRERRALTLALQQMEEENLISPARAREIAHGVLHDNAIRLYQLSK